MALPFYVETIINQESHGNVASVYEFSALTISDRFRNVLKESGCYCWSNIYQNASRRAEAGIRTTSRKTPEENYGDRETKDGKLLTDHVERVQHGKMDIPSG